MSAPNSNLAEPAPPSREACPQTGTIVIAGTAYTVTPARPVVISWPGGNRRMFKMRARETLAAFAERITNEYRAATSSYAQAASLSAPARPVSDRTRSSNQPPPAATPATRTWAAAARPAAPTAMEVEPVAPSRLEVASIAPGLPAADCQRCKWCLKASVGGAPERPVPAARAARSHHLGCLRQNRPGAAATCRHTRRRYRAGENGDAQSRRRQGRARRAQGGPLRAAAGALPAEVQGLVVQGGPRAWPAGSLPPRQVHGGAPAATRSEQSLGRVLGLRDALPRLRAAAPAQA